MRAKDKGVFEGESKDKMGKCFGGIGQRIGGGGGVKSKGEDGGIGG